jgi:hypothetical protein
MQNAPKTETRDAESIMLADKIEKHNRIKAFQRFSFPSAASDGGGGCNQLVLSI